MLGGGWGVGGGTGDLCDRLTSRAGTLLPQRGGEERIEDKGTRGRDASGVVS